MSQGYERKTTKEIKKALQAEYPGVKFSVTKGRGTASHWIHVRYVNGPPEAVVRAFCGQYNDTKNDDIMTDLWCGSQYTNEYRELSDKYAWQLVSELDLTAGPPTLRDQIENYFNILIRRGFGGHRYGWQECPDGALAIWNEDGGRLDDLEWVCHSLEKQGYIVNVTGKEDQITVTTKAPAPAALEAAKGGTT
jgi:hypothetical protein